MHGMNSNKTKVFPVLPNFVRLDVSVALQFPNFLKLHHEGFSASTNFKTKMECFPKRQEPKNNTYICYLVYRKTKISMLTMFEERVIKALGIR